MLVNIFFEFLKMIVRKHFSPLVVTTCWVLDRERTSVVSVGGTDPAARPFRGCLTGTTCRWGTMTCSSSPRGRATSSSRRQGRPTTTWVNVFSFHTWQRDDLLVYLPTRTEGSFIHKHVHHEGASTGSVTWNVRHAEGWRE
jgi:hypothetical protein